MNIKFPAAVSAAYDSLAPYAVWIEGILSAPKGELLTLELTTALDEVIAAQIFKDVPIHGTSLQGFKLLSEAIQKWELPPDTTPRIEMHPFQDRTSGVATSWSASWRECPVAIWLREATGPVILARIPYTSMRSGLVSDWKEWLIVTRSTAASVLQALGPVCSVRTKRIRVTGGPSQLLDDKNGKWDDLVLPPDVHSLVRRDFEGFFAREEWFRKHHLPFKRGYLFYGAPGNGKTSVIRAMANHPGLSLFSVNFNNNKEVDDSAVASMFESARNSAPALVILEDLDRIFPRDGSRKEEVKVSLSGLLNSLDGVVVQEGLIVTATANNPEQLDPAVLNRPGRFDRVIEFRNPSAEVRAGYFQKISGLDASDSAEIVESTDGFSFAQLRETYILAGQFAFEEERDIQTGDLLQAATAMRSQSCKARGGLGAKVGFGPEMSLR